jgi:hydrogenase expression/formation protein HypD
MKYITEYRDKELAKKLVADIAKEARPDRNYRLMEFCGGHTAWKAFCLRTSA